MISREKDLVMVERKKTVQEDFFHVIQCLLSKEDSLMALFLSVNVSLLFKSVVNGAMMNHTERIMRLS